LREIFTTRTADSGNYGKFYKRSNRIRPKYQKSFGAAKNIAPRRRVWLHPVVPIQLPAAPVARRHRLNVFYAGRVQGVGFRHAVKTVAAGFEIAGLVRNLPDGRVELVAEGTREELEAFRAAIRDAVLAGLIQNEQLNWAAAQNEFRGFEISR
jgi:acylphosphatase